MVANVRIGASITIVEALAATGAGNDLSVRTTGSAIASTSANLGAARSLEKVTVDAFSANWTDPSATRAETGAGTLGVAATARRAL